MLDVDQLHVEVELLDPLGTNRVLAALLLEHFAQIANIIVVHAAQDLALLRIDEVSGRFVRGLAKHLARLQAAAGAGDHLLAAGHDVAAARGETRPDCASHRGGRCISAWVAPLCISDAETQSRRGSIDRLTTESIPVGEPNRQTGFGELPRQVLAAAEAIGYPLAS